MPTAPLQGPTVSPVYTPESIGGGGNGSAGSAPHLFGAVVCVPKKQLYACVKELRKVLGCFPPQSCIPFRALLPLHCFTFTCMQEKPARSARVPCPGR